MAEGIVLIDLDEDLETLSWEHLKARCKSHGIKCNLKKEEMKYALKQLDKGKPVPRSYYTKNWLSEPANRKKIVRGGLSCGGLIILAIIIWIIFNSLSNTHSNSTPIVSNITNNSLF